MPEPTRDKPAVYKIRVQGSLADDWTDQMSDLTMTVQGDPGTSAITTLTGVIPDQETLESILSTLYSLGLPLLAVEYLAEAPSPHTGHEPPVDKAPEGDRQA